MISRVTQGCQPIGPRRLVSRAQDNFVITLDGRGALDCVMEDLGLPPDMALEPVAEALSNTLVGLHPGEDVELVAPAAFGADMLVRNIIGMDPRGVGRSTQLRCISTSSDQPVTVCGRPGGMTWQSPAFSVCSPWPT